MVLRHCVPCSLSLFTLKHVIAMKIDETFACDPWCAESLTKAFVYRCLSGMPSEHHFFWSYFVQTDTNTVVDVVK